MDRQLVSGALMLVVGATGCGLIPAPPPSEIPIGGPRAGVIAVDIVEARQEMEGGLLEPTWLPEGFELVNVGYLRVGHHIESADLNFDDGTRYLHVWQTLTELDPESDPLRGGEQAEVGDVVWLVERPPAAQLGRENVLVYSTRMADGRTVSVDSDLGAEVMERVLASLAIGVREGG